MTDARYPERWLTDRRLLRLSDAQHRTFVVALVWSVSNRTDGRLDRHDLDLIVGCDTGPSIVAALVAAKLWRADGDCWHILDFGTSQTSASELEVLDNLRRRDREKKARQRGTKAGAAAEPVPGDCPGERSPGTAKARQVPGKDQAQEDEAPTNAWDDDPFDVAEPGRPRCAVCHEPMIVVEVGQQTHPTCSAAA